ncbi:hypothetical protein OS187_08590 [Xanthomonadaceae bacterium JHOS43]|nr:hypothetical protein [Xanthomonadaceae bacterium JHOS43]
MSYSRPAFLRCVPGAVAEVWVDLANFAKEHGGAFAGQGDALSRRGNEVRKNDAAKSVASRDGNNIEAGHRTNRLGRDRIGYPDARMPPLRVPAREVSG